MDETTKKRRQQSAQPQRTASPQTAQTAAATPAPQASPQLSSQPMLSQNASESSVGAFGVKGINSYPDGKNAVKAMNKPVDEEQCRKWNLTLAKYKSGKSRLEQRIIESERWWKLRNQYEEQKLTDPKNGGMRSGSAWLHNVIVNKHADAMDSYPQPNILAREESDKVEAWSLTQIVPCVMEQNHFEDVYSAIQWQKLKTGSGVYKVTWDANKNNGLGDINIVRVDLLNLYWEPGIEDIQDSRMVFHTETFDKDVIVEQYPELEDKRLDSSVTPRKFPTDDTVSDENKVVVIDVYYKKKGQLHYAKYVGDTVLYSSENNGKPLYDHGLYPFVFDTLYPIEGSPAGYGLIDVCVNPQTRIDALNTAMLRNALVSCTPRYFERQDGSINEEEFLNLENSIVHVNGNITDDSIKLVDTPSMGTYYTSYLQQTVQELRETSGNTETSSGTVSSSAMAASAIAALQEASGKSSRDACLNSYRAYSKVVNLVIELIRQFYDLPRQFRITGQMGVQRYIEFTNAGMQPQAQGNIGGVDMGYRLPVYDIKIEPQKVNRYTQLAQNEMAKELFGLGLFNPQNVDQALMVLNMMDFDGKDQLMQKISQQGTMYQKLIQYQTLALSLAQMYQPDLVPGLAGDIQGQSGGAIAPIGSVGGMMSAGGYTDKNKDGMAEHPTVEKARQASNEAAAPTGSKVMR